MTECNALPNKTHNTNWEFLSCHVLFTLLRIPWTANRTNQSILQQLRVKTRLSATYYQKCLSYFGHIARRQADNLERLFVVGMVEGKRPPAGHQVVGRIKWPRSPDSLLRRPEGSRKPKWKVIVQRRRPFKDTNFSNEEARRRSNKAY